MPQSKEVHKEYMRVHRKQEKGSQTQGSQEGSQEYVTLNYDYDRDLTPRERAVLCLNRTKDQKDRFPNIPLPFGQAYYQALAEQI